MKRALLIAAATLVSASAFASVGLSVRSDYINTMKGKNEAAADVDGNSDFVASYARMTLGGKVGEAEVVGNLDLTGSASPLTFVNHLYIKKSFADGWAMTAGKLVNLTGGFEAQAIDAGNDYWASMANGTDEINNSGAAFTSLTQRLSNSSGAGIHWASGNHGVEFQVTNTSDFATNGATGSHNFGLAYTGGLTESLWLKAHYFNGFVEATDLDQNFMGVGVRWAAAPFDITFDYLMNGVKAAAGGDTNTTSSMVANVKYSMDNMTPFLKFESSSNKDKIGADAETLTRTAFTVGLEMAQGNDFRYHLAYSSASDKYDATDETAQASRLLAGIKWDTDLLK